MKKRFLLVAAVGIGAGLFYALRGNRGEQSTSSTLGEADGESKAAQSPKLALNDGRPRLQKDQDGIAGKLKQDDEPEIDDRGTHQFEAAGILKHIRDGAFEASDEKLALALGRPTEEIEEWTAGTGIIDGDVIMKARALALQRGIEIE